MLKRISWRTWWLASLVLFCLVCGPSPAYPGDDAGSGRIRTLVITGGHAFEEQPFAALYASIADVQATHVTYPAAADQLRPDLADAYDVIVFYDMWARGISPQQQAAFVALLNRGIGIVALHHTLGAHAEWPEYQKIIGGRLHLKEREVDGKKLPKSGYDHDQDIAVKVADREHPITRGLEDFTIHDETYCNYDTDPAARVLLTTDHPKSDRELAWVKEYGRSRVFCLQLGHDHYAYEHPSFRELIARGIRWAAGGPVRPESPPSQARPAR